MYVCPDAETRNRSEIEIIKPVSKNFGLAKKQFSPPYLYHALTQGVKCNANLLREKCADYFTLAINKCDEVSGDLI